jgi:hypothetical protein
MREKGLGWNWQVTGSRGEDSISTLGKVCSASHRTVLPSHQSTYLSTSPNSRIHRRHRRLHSNKRTPDEQPQPRHIPRHHPTPPYSSSARKTPSTPSYNPRSSRTRTSMPCITGWLFLADIINGSLGIPNHLVLFRPGLASKPRLWLGLRRLWLSQHTGQAKALNQGLALAWPGPGRGFSM